MSPAERADLQAQIDLLRLALAGTLRMLLVAGALTEHDVRTIQDWTLAEIEAAEGRAETHAQVAAARARPHLRRLFDMLESPQDQA